ncbi:hypothetical protein C0971_10025 [Bacillus methanolicus]|uniref:hypothetical protein n=1 Tax=Bacillus methanolicus TaxID=1471 RepID=UPI0020104938|nr:hypothetical protein [Bacillus methanolicus]UQD52309.1 hypothetical protein C0971_10025 [Bacillus methanolicus]
MKQFEFADLIEEFQVPFTYYEEAEGYWNDEGDYVKGEVTSIQMYGAILPLSEDDLQYAETGTYSVKDRKIYTTQPLKLNGIIEYKGERFTIQNFKDYSDYADVYVYLARWREK